MVLKSLIPIFYLLLSFLLYNNGYQYSITRATKFHKIFSLNMNTESLKSAEVPEEVIIDELILSISNINRL